MDKQKHLTSERRQLFLARAILGSGQLIPKRLIVTFEMKT